MVDSPNNPKTRSEFDLSVFRSYDIRGIYGSQVNEEFAERLGKAFGAYIGKGKKICVARDYRNGSQSMKDSFTKGALSMGLDVIDLGVIPTPIFYFSIMFKEYDGGAMITASHNPAIWNGFKVCSKNADVIGQGSGMERLKEIFVEGKFDEIGTGKSSTYGGIVDDYTNHVLNTIKIKRKLKVVLDPGNGAWAGIARKIFERFGCEVIEINEKPDPLFSSRNPDPSDQALKQLKEMVPKLSADFGAGFDADGDRVGLVDDKGKYAGTGSRIIPVFARYVLKGHENAKVVYDVPCSLAVEEVVKECHGIPIICRTGHGYMMEKMRSESALLAGEYSNHIYFSDNMNMDDGGFAALKMAEIISNGSESLSELFAQVPDYPSVPVQEIECPDNIKFNVIDSVKQNFAKMGFERIIDIDGIKAFTNDGWVLVRASNTVPAIKINSEGKTTEVAEKLFNSAKDLVEKQISASAVS